MMENEGTDGLVDEDDEEIELDEKLAFDRTYNGHPE